MDAPIVITVEFIPCGHFANLKMQHKLPWEIKFTAPELCPLCQHPVGEIAQVTDAYRDSSVEAYNEGVSARS